MKIDVINTKYGEFVIEFTKHHYGFYIGSFPNKLKEKSGLSIKHGRDNHFDTYQECKEYIYQIVSNANIDYEFKRKVIGYYASVWESGTFVFKYFIANESEQNIPYLGKENVLSEYTILESSEQRWVGKRNTLGQITGSSKDYQLIDYDEKTHKFIVDFLNNFNKLTSNVIDFFDKDKVKENIINSLNGNTKLIG